MPQYRAIPAAIINLPDPWGVHHAAGGETIIEQDKTPIKTGLVDARGVPLYRVPDSVPFGFQPPKP
jgi:hypothetical protein